MTVRQCPSDALVSGAVVTVKDSGGATVGSGTTDATGIVTVTIPAAATYTIVVAKTGQNTVTATQAATCTTNNVAIKLGIAASYTVRTCAVGAIGITVTLTHATSGRVFTGVTNSSGAVTVAVGESGNYNYSIPAFRHTTRTGSANLPPGFCTTSGGTQDLDPATGYHCLFLTTGCMVPPAGLTNSECFYPIADTLFLTDSAYGTTTLTWSSSAGGVGIGGWSGTKAVSTPACAPDPASSTTLTYLLRQASFPTSGSPNLRIFYDSTNVTATCVTSDFCPPSIPVDLDFTIAGGGTANKPYCTAGATFVITE